MKKIQQVNSLDLDLFRRTSKNFCNRLFSENITMEDVNAMASMGFMILLDGMYDNGSKDIIISRLEELDDNKS